MACGCALQWALPLLQLSFMASDPSVPKSSSYFAPSSGLTMPIEASGERNSTSCQAVPSRRAAGWGCMQAAGSRPSTRVAPIMIRFIEASGNRAIWPYHRPFARPIATIKTGCHPEERSMAEYRKDAAVIAKLTPEQYRVTQQSGTEMPGTGEYLDNHEPGIYVDIVSGEPL